MTREAGDFVAGLGLGHLGIEGQVHEAVEEQPAVHIQERGEAAAARRGEGSPGARRRGGSSRSPRRAAQLHDRRGGHGPRLGRRRAAMAAPPAHAGQGQLPLRRNNPAREIQTPRFLLAVLSSLPPSGPQRCLLRPLQPLARRHSRGEARQRQHSAIRPFSSSSSSGLIAPVFFHGGELPLDLVLSPRQICPPPARTHTHQPRSCSPRLPLLLCGPSARGTHAGGSEEERGEAGAAAVPSPVRQSVRWEVRAAGPRSFPHRRGGSAAAREGSFYPPSVKALRGREAGGGRGRRVNSPSASQLTASTQPFLKGNCHLLAEPPARSNAPRPSVRLDPSLRPSLGGGGRGARPGRRWAQGAGDPRHLRPERGRRSRANRTPAAPAHRAPLPPLPLRSVLLRTLSRPRLK